MPVIHGNECKATKYPTSLGGNGLESSLIKPNQGKSSLAESNPVKASQGQSNLVKPSPTESGLIRPNPAELSQIKPNQASGGDPGQVTNQQLTDAIAGTSNTSNSIQLLNLTVSDPPTQSELQAVANKMDELINALRR